MYRVRCRPSLLENPPSTQSPLRDPTRLPWCSTPAHSCDREPASAPVAAATARFPPAPKDATPPHLSPHRPGGPLSTPRPRQSTPVRSAPLDRLPARTAALPPV